MNNRIARPARALPFLALAACACAGMGEEALLFLCAAALSRGLSLSAGMAFRACAGQVVNPARLRGNFLLALLLSLLGGAGAAAIFWAAPDASVWMASAGALFSLALLASDRLSAFPRFRASADVLTALLTAAGFFLLPRAEWLPALAEGLAFAAGLILCANRTRPLRTQMGFRLLTRLPRGLLRGFLIPAMLGIVAFLSLYLAEISREGVSLLRASGDAVGILGGAKEAYAAHLGWSSLNLAAALCACLWGLTDAVSAPFRRSQREGHLLRAMLALLGSSLTCAALFVPEFADLLPAYQVSALTVVSLILLESPMDWITPLCALTMLGAGFFCLQALDASARYPWQMWLSLALALGALALTIPDILSLRRILRARNLQRKREKR